MGLAEDARHEWEALETLRARAHGAPIIVPPTVIQELVAGAEVFDDQHRRELALRALTSMLDWGLAPVSLIPAGHGIVERIGAKLRAKGLLPPGEVNDSLIVAESGLLEADFLITSDEHLLGIDPNRLRAELAACDVSTVLPIHPRLIAKYFPRR